MPATEVDLLTEFRERSARLVRPWKVLLEVTRKCNLSCLHCYALPQGGGREELTTPETLRVIDALHDEGALYLFLTGGEVTLNPDFLRIVRHARRRRMAVQVLSNGTRIDRPLARALARLGIVQVSLSIYGADEETHEEMTRRRGSFEATLDAVRNLRAEGIPVQLKLVLTRINADETPLVEALAAEMGAVFVSDPVLTPRDNRDRRPLALRATDGQLRVWLRGRTAHLASPEAPGGFPDDYFACAAAKTLCSVNAYGDVYPCPNLPIAAGNVRERPFSEIWRGAAVLEEIRSVTTSSLHVCPSCAVASHCTRCPGQALMEGGSLYGPSPESCRRARIAEEVSREGRRESPALDAEKAVR